MRKTKQRALEALDRLIEWQEYEKQRFSVAAIEVIEDPARLKDENPYEAPSTHDIFTVMNDPITRAYWLGYNRLETERLYRK